MSETRHIAQKNNESLDKKIIERGKASEQRGGERFNRVVLIKRTYLDVLVPTGPAPTVGEPTKKTGKEALSRPAIPVDFNQQPTPEATKANSYALRCVSLDRLRRKPAYVLNAGLFGTGPGKRPPATSTNKKRLVAALHTHQTKRGSGYRP